MVVYGFESLNGKNTYVIFDFGHSALQQPESCIMHDQNYQPLALRMRGAGGDANVDKHSNEIPYLSKMNYLWNGYPSIDHDENVMQPLRNGLGTMYMRGKASSRTLLATVERKDPGGVIGTPPRAAAPQDVIEDSDLANVRAFSCITNYINPKSYVYHLYITLFSGDGIAVYRHMMVWGKLPVPQRTIYERNDIWNRMTMDNLRLPYNEVGFWSWIEVVATTARKIGKDGNAQREKFLSGLPAFFSGTVDQMRHAKLLYPANYGMMPGFAGNIIAANPHPMAGQHDIWSYGRAYYADWITKMRDVARKPPHGMVRMAEIFNVDLPVSMEECNLLASDITDQTKCDACGGDHHAASQILPSGDRYVCAKVRLEQLRRSGDLEGKSLQNANAKPTDYYKKKSRAFAKEITSLQSKLEAMEMDRSSKPSRRLSRREANLTTDESDASGVSDGDSHQPDSEDANSMQQNSDDDDVSSNASSHVQDFADAAMKSKRNGRDARKQRK